MISAPLQEIKKHLSDREWRLNNLYYIRDEKGNKVLFKLNETQKYLLDNLWFFNIVPKARQLGITTFFAILYLDQILWSNDKSAGIIAHRQEDLKKIFKSKIKYAVDNLHPWLKEKIGKPNTDNAYELSFKNGSNIFVSMNTRSGTVQFLHISEFAYICQKFPDKAKEIVTGSINSVHAGCMVSIESTARGSEGKFFEFVMEAEKRRKEGRALTPLDFKIFFFPWYLKDEYTLEGDVVFTTEILEYFKTLDAKHGIKLTDGQKRWYIKKKELNGEEMSQEFPSTLQEAFSVSQEGAYYANQMSKVYLQNRICILPVDPNVEVDTYWDLGINDFNVILFTQTIGPIIRFVDMYFNSGEGLQHYVDVLNKRKYRYGKHVFPFDVNVKELGTGLTRKEQLYNLGMYNIWVAPKLLIHDGIESVRRIFPRFWFDEEKTQKLYEMLPNYRKEWDDKLSQFKDKPLHNEASHFADAVRTLATVWKEELPVGEYDSEDDREQSFFA
ncbi:MAG TPA: terminase [bacterium]|nr:terminase [bacterium]